MIARFKPANTALILCKNLDIAIILVRVVRTHLSKSLSTRNFKGM